MQLVAYGAQDVFLTGNPQVTFFKNIFRRYTNFAIESIEQTFTGAADFGKKVTCTVSRTGDLIHRTYLRVEIPEVKVSPGRKFRWLNSLGHILLKTADVDVGGMRIDKHYGDWLHIWNELTQTAGHQLGYANMMGNIPRLTNVTEVADGATDSVIVPGHTLYIPLEFWFCTNTGLALPLIALQYHEVRINVEFGEKKDCYWAQKSDGSGGWVADQNSVQVNSLNSASLFIDYIFLDTEERRRFAKVAHEYLIEQLQFTGDESTNTQNNKLKLSLNHPVKELIFVVQPDEFTGDEANERMGKEWFNFTDDFDPSLDPASSYTASGSMPGVAAGGSNGTFLPVNFDGGKNCVKQAKLQLNGHDRFAERDGMYFNVIQNYQHHENVPKNGINVYSFALKPEEHQPSGTCNMSRIDTVQLNLTLTKESTKNAAGDNRTCKIKVYGRGYNILRVMSGMGGLAYSN